MSEIKEAGSCYCGKVKFNAVGNLMGTWVCHCRAWCAGSGLDSP